MTMSTVSDITVTSCSFRNSGGGGVRADGYAQRVRIANNTFADLGYEAVGLYGLGLGLLHGLAQALGAAGDERDLGNADPMKTAAFTLPTQPKSGRNPPPGGSPLNLLDEVPSPQRYLALLPDDIKLRLELAGYNWKRLSHAGISDIWWRMPGSARAWLHTAGFSLVGQNKCTSTVGVEATKAEPPPSPEAHLLTPAGAPVAGITGAAM